MSMLKQYFWNILISLDQFVNTLFGGYPDETISSRIGKKMVKKENCVICKGLCWILNKIDKDHCIKSIEVDEGEAL